MRREKPDLAPHFLHGAVRVIEKRSFLMHRELVNVLFSRRNGLLADVGHAVLPDGNLQTVPVQGSGLWQAIFEDDAHAVALLHLNRRPGTAPVVAPRVDRLEGGNLSLHWLGDETENFYAALLFV